MSVDISQVSHRYGDRVALDRFSLRIDSGEIFAFLGPNGSGKTTLFRLLSTLIPLQSGEIRIAGLDIAARANEVRQAIGVVFQASSVDRKLTVSENLRHQGHLYGLAGAELRRREEELLARLGLTDRKKDRVESLSGGLRRRVELAKGMLHRPSILFLDEPSTGLDPGARIDLWEILTRLRSEGTTIVLTTHLLDEAERADRIAILDGGREVALDTPEALRQSVGGDSITIETEDPKTLARLIGERFSCDTSALPDSVRMEQPDGHHWIPKIVDAFGESITAITLGKPTLADVFIARTGHRFWEDKSESEDEKK